MLCAWYTTYLFSPRKHTLLCVLIFCKYTKNSVCLLQKILLRARHTTCFFCRRYQSLSCVLKKKTNISLSSLQCSFFIPWELLIDYLLLEKLLSLVIIAYNSSYNIGVKCTVQTATLLVIMFSRQCLDLCSFMLDEH